MNILADLLEAAPVATARHSKATSVLPAEATGSDPD